MNGKIIKTLGIAATVVGIGASLFTDWVEDKKLDEKIETKVNEALANESKENEEES